MFWSATESGLAWMEKKEIIKKGTRGNNSSVHKGNQRRNRKYVQTVAGVLRITCNKKMLKTNAYLLHLPHDLL